MSHKFECFWSTQKEAIDEFNLGRKSLEEMYQSKIKVIKMYKKFFGDWIVEYELVEQ